MDHHELSKRRLTKSQLIEDCTVMSVFDQYRLPGDVLMVDIGKTHTKISRRSSGVFGAPCAGSQVVIRSPQVHAGPFPAIDTKAISGTGAARAIADADHETNEADVYSRRPWCVTDSPCLPATNLLSR